MLYCDLCGAANDILSAKCHRCGGALGPNEASIPESVAVPTTQRISHKTETGDSSASQEIGTSLDLPDWLKRAAAQTPEMPVGDEPHAKLPPAGFHLAPAEISAAPEQPQPLPSIPTAGLSAAMPDWLRAQPSETTAPGAAAASTAPAAGQPAPPDADAANMATFISESDLPDWIRQIAEADAAKQAEGARLAAEAARRSEGESPKRVVLPGEQDLPATVVNPWLNRRDAPSASQARSAPHVVTPVPATDEQVESAYEPVHAGEVASSPSEAALKRGLAPRTPRLSAGKHLGLKLPGASRVPPSKRSPFLVGGIILLLIVLLLML